MRFRPIRRKRACASAFIFAAAAYVSAGAAAFPGSIPPCGSERSVAGWTVTAGLAPEKAGSLLVGKWEASRKFSTQFGLHVTYDTSEGPDPALEIWHNYKSGGFAMQMPDRTSFSVPLSANYAITRANVPPEVIAYLRRTRALIEHTHSGTKRDVYHTDGLPEAIAAAEDDLAVAEEQRNNQECGEQKGWWRRLNGDR